MKECITGLLLLLLSNAGFGSVVALQCAPTTVSFLDTKKTFDFSEGESCKNYRIRQSSGNECNSFKLEFSASETSAYVDKPYFFENSLQFTKKDAYEYEFKRIGLNSEALRVDITLQIDRVSLEYVWSQTFQTNV